MLEFRLQRHPIGELAILDAPNDRLVDAAMDRIDKVLGCEEFRDPFIRAVVRQ